MLNALRSYLFFGRQRVDLAFIDAVALWIAIVAMVVLFWRHDRWAGALMAPFLLWVSFASCLNFAVWRLNAA